MIVTVNGIQIKPLKGYEGYKTVSALVNMDFTPYGVYSYVIQLYNKDGTEYTDDNIDCETWMDVNTAERSVALQLNKDFRHFVRSHRIMGERHVDGFTVNPSGDYIIHDNLIAYMQNSGKGYMGQVLIADIDGMTYGDTDTYFNDDSMVDVYNQMIYQPYEFWKSLKIHKYIEETEE